MKVKEENIVFLKVSSWKGISIGAGHFYGVLIDLVTHESVELSYPLTQKEADCLNKKAGFLTSETIRTVGYKVGEASDRFPNEEQVITTAKKQFKKSFPTAAILILGDHALAEPQQVLVGPKEFKNKINILAKQYDKLDWDDVVDRPMIEKIEEEWQKLWPRKYM